MVLALLVGAAFAAGRWPRNGAIALLVASLLWLGSNKGVEGPVIFELTMERGMVAADLAALVGLVIAGALLWRHR